MDSVTFADIEKYMCSCMSDAAHDKQHVYRVLYNAVEIAKTERGVNYDVLIAACLLHDIGRKEQFEDSSKDHAEVGAQKARAFLIERGADEATATAVADCIKTHRFRKDRAPQSVEAKILFDADKLDVTGAMGIARLCIKARSATRCIRSIKTVCRRTAKTSARRPFFKNTISN